MIIKRQRRTWPPSPPLLSSSPLLSPPLLSSPLLSSPPLPPSPPPPSLLPSSPLPPPPPLSSPPLPSSPLLSCVSPSPSSSNRTLVVRCPGQTRPELSLSLYLVSCSWNLRGCIASSQKKPLVVHLHTCTHTPAHTHTHTPAQTHTNT